MCNKLINLNLKKLITLVLYLISYNFIVLSESFANISLKSKKLTLDENYEFVDIEILAGKNNIKNNSKFLGGIKVTLLPEWKIYWKNPGDAGLPPSISLENGNNIKSIKLLFPSPTRFNFYDIETLGYENEVIFPIEIQVIKSDLPISGQLVFNAQVCSNICVPIKKIFNLTSFENINKNKNLLNFNQINKYLLKVPLLIKDNKLKLLSSNFQNNVLNVIFSNKNNFNPYDIIIEDSKSRVYQKPNFYTKNSLMYISLNIDQTDEGYLSDLKFNYTFVGSNNSLEKKNIPINILLSKAGLDFKQKSQEYALNFEIILIALLGGFILNFMPCVLPVLSLKMIQIINYRNSSKLEFRSKIFASILGILSSFIVLAISVYFIKISGDEVGWGIQFQNKYFLFFMIVLTLTFCLNLFGFYEFYLPSKLLNLLSYRGSGLVGDFLSGVFMTLLATPCTAPFVGTAIGFALAGSTFEIFTIFLFMGIGLSLPLIVFSIFPRLVSFIPKPGNWLNVFKKIMGLLLLGTSIWLISLFLNLNSNFQNISKNQNSENILNWDLKNNPFLPQKLAKEGKVVLIDITADWCITCKVNKTIVLDSKEIIVFLKNNNVITLRLDWTKPDEEISKFLLIKKRYGIPYNEVYGPLNLDGKILPELLTKEIIFKYVNSSK